MKKKDIIEHVNNYHHDSLKLIFKAHSILEPKTIKLINYDSENLFFLLDDGKQLQIPYPHKLKSTDLNEFKTMFILMTQRARNGFSVDKIKESLRSLMFTCNSVVLATLIDGYPLSSCSILFRYQEEFFIYISELAMHYHSIKQNPDKISVMWLEDEKCADLPLIRKRAVFRAKASFINDQAIVEAIFNHYINEHGSAGGIGIIKKMNSGMHRFHLVKLELQSGRFVQGFGQAYDINYPDLTIRFLNPQATKI